MLLRLQIEAQMYLNLDSLLQRCPTLKQELKVLLDAHRKNNSNKMTLLSKQKKVQQVNQKKKQLTDNNRWKNLLKVYQIVPLGLQRQAQMKHNLNL